MRHIVCLACAVFLLCAGTPLRAGDWNLDGLGDIWATYYESTNLASMVDTDGDGVPNWAESIAGTDPRDPNSVHAVSQSVLSNRLTFTWYGLRGKRYDLMARSNLMDLAWSPLASWSGTNAPMAFQPPASGDASTFWSIRVVDVDSDGDGLSDWEELMIGLQPDTNRSHRTSMTDSNKVRNALRGTNWVTVAAIDSAMQEDWPDPGVFAIRRTGRIDRITVPFTLSGSATPGSDYTLSATSSITLEPGVREAWVYVHPRADALNESTETIALTLGTSAWYRLGTPSAATVTLANAAATNKASPKGAARFLSQATFGVKTQEIAQVTNLGYYAWITNQFAIAPSHHSTYMQTVEAAYTNIWSSHKDLVWWHRSVNAPDQLRQRMAWALSQIFVVSDASDRLAGEWRCMTAYYDLLLGKAFGNFGDLLLSVALHPAMGIYLSHMGNEKADPATGRFPDENFAREVMQLFSIGLWELNPDGTRVLTTNGQPIATYNNADITELARAFTGLSWPQGNTNYWWEFYWPTNHDLTGPMRIWTEYHDTNSKALLRGTIIPAGQPPMRDVHLAVSNLFLHPNVPPFIGRQLIQRFTTSNPSTAYVARVSAAFTNNGSGVRGDLKAVLLAILLDPEARDPAHLANPAWGKLREPYLRPVHLARSFNAASSNAFLEMWWIDDIYAMRPSGSPSVFNFYAPSFRPNGPLKDAGLVAPEFQIVTDVTAIMALNHIYVSLQQNGLNRWPYDPPTNVRLDLAPLRALSNNPDALIAHLDTLLTYGNLSPPHHQVIREAIERIPAAETNQRVNMAVYLISTSPEFAVLK